MYRIALNVAISAYRKRTSLRTAPLAEPEWDTQAQPDETHPSLQLLHRFIDELNEFDKALLLLYLEDKSHAEIAEILGISTSNVSTKIGRIKDKLKQRFEQVSEQNNLIK